MSKWSIYDEERRKCEQWLKDPLVNPNTGRIIDRNGPTYQIWSNKCKDIGKPVATREMTWSKCQEWRRDPTINPETGRKISRNGTVYKQIQKQCTNITENKIELLGEYYKPDQKGMVPCVLYRNRYYIVRNYTDEKGNSRKIWGSLNKLARTMTLHFYRDTWDYRYSWYRPIYVNGTEPVEEPNILPNKNNMRSKNAKNIVDGIFDIFTF